jgi:hypothetical protein
MQPEIQMFAQVMAIILGSVASLVAIGFGARILWKISSRIPQEPQVADSAQLKRIEGAIDGMALEMERISEAQRFTVAVLNERLAKGTDDKDVRRVPLAPVSRNNTPH